MCLKCVAQAEAELVGIRSHAKLLLFAKNGLFSFRVPQARKAIGKISRSVVGKSVGNASAGIPCENHVQIGGAFASHAGDFNLVLALEKAHAKARANLGCEGRTIKERNKKIKYTICTLAIFSRRSPAALAAALIQGKNLEYIVMIL